MKKIILAGFILSISLSATADEEMKEIKLQRLVRGYVEGHLKDPSSAKFRNQKGICGEVNAKNSFGGYMGYMRFIATNKDSVMFDDGSVFSKDRFDIFYHSVCDKM